MKIQFIGCGKMGEIILDSIIKSGFNLSKIHISAKTKETGDKLLNKYKINIGTNKNADIIILAIKPKQFNEIELNNFRKDAIIISIMAGVNIKKIREKNNFKHIIRTMPNTPMSVGKGVIGYYCHKIETDDLDMFKKLFSKTGELIECKKEDDIDKITALSGSGPAYFYYITEILRNKAIEMGFNKKDSKLISDNTFIGSANLLDKSGLDIVELRNNITSPGGTTQKAISTFEKNGLNKKFTQGIDKAYKKAKELSK